MTRKQVTFDLSQERRERYAIYYRTARSKSALFAYDIW